MAKVNTNNLRKAQSVPHRFVKSLSFGITDTLFAPSKLPWVVFDLFLTLVLFHIGVWLSPYGTWGISDLPIFAGCVIYATAFVALALGQGFFDRARRFDYFHVMRVGIFANLLAGLVSLGSIYFLFYEVVGRLTIIYGTLGAAIGTIGIHLVLSFVLGRNPYRFTIIGHSAIMDEIIGYCRSSSKRHQPYRYIPWSEVFKKGEAPDVDRLLAAKISDIVLTKEVLKDPNWVAFAVNALQVKFRVVDEIDFYLQILERVPIDEISHEWVLRQGIARRQVLTVAVKRWTDWFLSGAALIVLAPLLALIALAIKLSGPGPVLFVQNRQGRYSKPFKMYKFRTMKIEHSSPDAEGGFTRKGDERVTWVGKLIRPLHLDELPQLWNCFMGQMSLVGPRPEALQFAQKMRAALPLYDLRYLVRPGLTGHAQINQGYALDSVGDTKRKLSYDLYYLCFHTAFFDFYIMLKTVFYLSRGAR